MADQGLNREHYANLVRNSKPLCPGCLDIDSAIFDWRAVPWAITYPSLDPQKIILGARSQCTACSIIEAAFQSVGLELKTLHDPKCISLFHEGENSALLAMAFIDDKPTLVELYTACGECCINRRREACSCTIDHLLLHRQFPCTLEYSTTKDTSVR